MIRSRRGGCHRRGVFGVESMASMAVLVGGRVLPGFIWLLFPVSVEPSVVVFEGCRSPVFEGGPPDVEDIALVVRAFCALRAS